MTFQHRYSAINATFQRYKCDQSNVLTVQVRRQRITAKDAATLLQRYCDGASAKQMRAHQSDTVPHTWVHAWGRTSTLANQDHSTTAAAADTDYSMTAINSGAPMLELALGRIGR